MIIQGLTHAVLSTAIFADPFQALSPALAQKAIGVQLPGSNLSPVSHMASIEKHWDFTMKNHIMQHHQGFQALNVTVESTSNQADLMPKLSIIYGEIDQFLSHYPNENDYWEVINRELAKTILRDHPELSSISITLEILPTERFPYNRASIVTQSRTGENMEEWRFTARVPIQVQGDDLNYEVEYLYRNGITNAEYPDFVPISDRTTQLLMAALTKGESWEYANQDIATSILQKYPVLADFTSYFDKATKGGRRLLDDG